MRPPAIVMGMSPTGLAAVRSLGRAGITVFSIDPDPHNPAGSTRFGSFQATPDPGSDPEELLAALKELSHKISGPAVLTPADDGHVLFVSRNRAALKEDFIFCLPGEDLLERVVDKEGMAEICREAGFPHPNIHHAHSLAEAEMIADDIEYPSFVKPRYGHLWRKYMGNSSKGVEVRTKDDLLKVFRIIEPFGLEVIVQSIVPGPDTDHYSTMVLMGSGGEVRALSQYRKVRQFPPFFGVGSYSKTSHDDEITESSVGLLRSIGWEGPALVQHKRDERDGTPYVLEINPRWGMTTGLGVKAGVNHPLLQYLHSIGSEFDAVTEYRDGVPWMNMASDILSARFYMRRGDLSWYGWLRSLLAVRAHAFFDITDPMPFLKTYLRYLVSLRSYSFERGVEPHNVENLKEKQVEKIWEDGGNDPI